MHFDQGGKTWVYFQRERNYLTNSQGSGSTRGGCKRFDSAGAHLPAVPEGAEGLVLLRSFIS